MIRVGLNDMKLQYQHLQEMVPTSVNPESTPYYIFDRYSLDFLDRLYMLLNSANACHALVLFDPREVENLLRHINILDGVTFTLVPTKLDPSVHSRIYDFFMRSPLSTAYITWMSKLLLRPHKEIGTVSIDGMPVQYSKCSEDCPVLAKGCSKGLLFTELFHPMKDLPTDTEMMEFCAIHRDYSLRIVQDYLNSDLDMHQFHRMRRNFGIRNQYWIDPQRLFLGDTVNEEGLVENIPERGVLNV